MNVNPQQGLVIKKFSGFYYVQNPTKQIYECKLRGKIKQEVLTGDYVLFTPLNENKGILEKVLPRKNELYRPKIANINMVLLVFSYDKPAPGIELLDRLLVLSHYNQLKPVIVLNKCDLPIHPKAQFIKEYYPRIDYLVLETSAINEIGLADVKDIIKDTITVLAGPSGAGKSSLLKSIIKNIDIRTQEVSRKIGRGKHTTTHVQLYPLQSGGFIADTPGFSSLDLPRIPVLGLAQFFPEIEGFSRECKFADCLHYKEIECSVKEAVKNETIPLKRYNNYLEMLQLLMEKERCYS